MGPCALIVGQAYPSPPSKELGIVLSGALAGDHGGLEVRVAACMLDQVIAAHETLVTQWAQEALLTRVGPDVARQLIRAGKPLPTVGP